MARPFRRAFARRGRSPQGRRPGGGGENGGLPRPGQWLNSRCADDGREAAVPRKFSLLKWIFSPSLVSPPRPAPANPPALRRQRLQAERRGPETGAKRSVPAAPVAPLRPGGRPLSAARGSRYRRLLFAAAPLEAAVAGESSGSEPPVEKKGKVGCGDFRSGRRLRELPCRAAGGRFSTAGGCVGSRVGRGRRPEPDETRSAFRRSGISGREARRRADDLDNALRSEALVAGGKWRRGRLLAALRERRRGASDRRARDRAGRVAFRRFPRRGRTIRAGLPAQEEASVRGATGLTGGTGRCRGRRRPTAAARRRPRRRERCPGISATAGRREAWTSARIR